MTTEIKLKNKVFAILFDLSTAKEGAFPATDPSWPLQLLLMKRKKGHIVKKHLHKKIVKTTKQPQECLVVIKGEILASIFDRQGKLIAKKNVKAGQCLFITDGAHKVEILKSALMYEFKTGPYVDDKVFLKE